MIEVDNVSKAFNERASVGLTMALQSVSLTVQAREFVSVIGPSGCGKTTLLRLIGGLIRPDSGEVRINGAAVTGPGTDRGMVFQQFALLPWANVLDNVAFGLHIRKMGKDERYQIAQRLIGAVGLAGFERHYPRELSGGMQQRVGLARALAIDPAILLMDEPFGAVDEQTRRILQEDLAGIYEGSGKTVVFVTHSMSEAVRLGDRVVLMSARPGRVVESIAVPLPRPRPVDVERLPEFSDLTEYVWQRLKGMNG